MVSLVKTLSSVQLPTVALLETTSLKSDVNPSNDSPSNDQLSDRNEESYVIHSNGTR